MQEAFERVRPACDFGGVLASTASVSVVNGRLEAKNTQLAISQPINGIPDFSANSKALDFALRKVGECTVSVGESYLTLKSPTSTTRVPRGPQQAGFKKPATNTRVVEDIDDLLDALEDVYQFTEGDIAKPWSTGARFDGRLITATNGVLLCQAELTFDTGFFGTTVSRRALSYILQRRKSLTAWGMAPNGLLLEFDDGSWAAAARLPSEMPDSALTALDKFVDPAAWDDLAEITPVYRSAFMSAIDYTETDLTIYPDRIEGVRLASNHECHVTSRLPAGTEKVKFNAKQLTAVINRARSVGFHYHPKPCPFITTRGSRGVIVALTEPGDKK